MGDPKHGAAPKAVTRDASSASDVTRLSGPHLVASDVRPLNTGSLLSHRYEILSLLGYGGMGAVYRAHDCELDRDVALKTIRSDLANDPAILRRFKHELVLARQITHRNVIRIYDIGEADGLKYITMEYVEGQDLASVLRTRNKITAMEAADIIAQTCEGLAAAHNEGVIHRDLKPSNIMVANNGRVYVMDFGLARTYGQEGMTQTGALLGTVEYMSPEQARGEKLDARSDIYTVGLIFYELLTGETPFKAESGIASLWKRMQTPATPANLVDPTVPAALSDIVQRCMEADRNKRYESAREVLADLAKWDAKALAHAFAPYPAVATGTSERDARRASPWPWIVLAVGIIAVAIASFIGFRHQETAAKPHAPVSLLITDFDNRTHDPVFDGTLEAAMSLALEGAPFISSYARADAHKIAAQISPGATNMDEAVGRLVAVREGVSVVVSGMINRDGALTVTVRAIDAANGNVLVSRSAEAAGKDAVLRTVSDLAATVRKALGDTTPEAAQASAAETFTSSSLEAAHEYAVAQNLQWAGKWEEAVLHYGAALQRDANMGRAYAGMAVTTANMGQRQTAENFFKLALAHTDRMSEREKLRTRGSYYLFMREPQKAIEEYSALVKEFPADSAAYGNLALAHFYTRDMETALHEGIRASELSPKALLQKNNVALYAVYAGDYVSGARCAREVIAANATYVDAYGALAMSQMGQGQIADAVQTYAKLKQINARGASAAVAGLADVALYQGRSSDAVPLLADGIAKDSAATNASAAAIKLIALGEAYLQSGDKRQALAAAERALTLDKQASTLYAAGVIYATAGQTTKAGPIADQLDSRIEPEPQMYARLLRGEIALNSGTPLQALQAFQQAQRVADSRLGHFALGRAYLAADKFAEANSEFETCVKRRGESSAVFLDDVPTFRYLPEVYYYLARTQQGLHSPAAAESYKTFLAMRTSDDTLARDAKRRVASH